MLPIVMILLQIAGGDAAMCPAEASVQTVSSLVKSISFAAVYEVVDISEDTIPTDDGMQLHSYQSYLAQALFGNPPSELDGYGFLVESSLPQYYFAITDRHRDMIENDSVVYSTGVVSYLEDENGQGRCVTLNEVVVGYRYLALGGVISPASFEVVHSMNDPWVEFVTEQVGK